MKSRIKWFLICMLCMVFACGCAHALTYEEAISQASDSGELADYLVTRPVPEERVYPGIPDGLAATWTYENNVLVITVDAEKTDWDQVIVKNYFPGAGLVYLYPGMKSPSGESMPHRSTGYSIGGGNNEKYLLELMKRDYEQWGTNSSDVCTNGWELGRYDEESGLFQPSEKDLHGVFCVWGEDGELQPEYLVFSLQYTSTAPITIKLPKVPAADIYPLYNMPESDRERFVSTSANGSVYLETDSFSDLSQTHGGFAVAVPEEAGDAAWTCRIASSSFSWDCVMMDPAQSGLPRRAAHVRDVYFDSNHITHEDNCTLEWRDETGAVRGYATLYISVIVGDPQPWPYHVAEWKPVPVSRMTLDKNHFPAGVDAVYDGNGLLTLTIDHDQLPETANFGRAFYEVMVSPPTDSIGWVGNGQSSANNIFGVVQANDFKDQSLQRVRDTARDISLIGSAVGNHIFQTYHQQGSDLTVYMTSEMTGPYAGRVALISWWEDGKDPSVDDPYLTEYIVVRQENCVRVLRSTPLNSEEELPEVITQPVIIIPQGSLKNPNSSMEFTAMIYPQKGEKSRYYKLELVDEDGNPVDLEKGQYKVFLPFPDGISEEDKQNLELIHMTDAHVEIESMSINGGTLHLTDAGIWFQAKSFSPFMLKWGEESTGGGGESIPSGECPNGHTLQYFLAMEGRGLAEVCTGEDCHAAFVEFVGPEKDEYVTGEPVEMIRSWEGDWLGLAPTTWYAASGSNEWDTEVPSEPGDYVVHMEHGSLITVEYAFSIIDGEYVPEVECGNGNPLRYELVTRPNGESNGIRQYCPDGCHDVNISFFAPFDITEGEELDYVCSWSGPWLGEVYPDLEFAMNVDGEYSGWSTTLPTAAGDYAMRMSFNGLITDYQTFSIYPAEENDTELILPANLTKIEPEAFAGTDVTSVICPDGLKEIGSRAFANCENLAVIVIPGSVDVLAQDALEGCENVLIVGEDGSAAQQFADDAGFPFEEI